MQRILVVLTIILVLLYSFPIKAKSLVNLPVVLNELMPNPKGTDTGNEWIELYNSSSSDISLTGWQIKDKTSSYSLSGQTIKAKSFLVVFPTVSLNNTDEVITLFDNMGNEDQITYSTSTEGISLERINPLCTDLKAHPTGDSKGLVNQSYDANYCQTSLKASVFTRKVNTTNWNEDHTYFVGDQIEAKLETNSQEKIINIKWNLGSLESAESEPKFYINNFQNENNLGVEITFESGTKLSSNITLALDYALKLNEILPDPDGADTGSEWIEVYNSNNFDVYLKDWQLKIGTKSQVLAAENVKPNGFLIISPSYSLTNTGTEVSLISPHGLISDNFKYDYSQTDFSWERNIDGVGDWIISSQTKGVTNTVYGIAVSSTEDDTSNSDRLEKSSSPSPLQNFIPKLDFPNYFKLDLGSKTSLVEPKDLSFRIVKTNKIAFGILFLLELVTYAFLVMEKEERTSASKALLKLVKG